MDLAGRGGSLAESLDGQKLDGAERGRRHSELRGLCQQLSSRTFLSALNHQVQQPVSPVEFVTEASVADRGTSCERVYSPVDNLLRSRRMSRLEQDLRSAFGPVPRFQQDVATVAALRVKWRVVRANPETTTSHSTGTSRRRSSVLIDQNKARVLSITTTEPGDVPQQFAVRLFSHVFPRTRQAGRSTAARRRGGAREDQLPQGSRDSHAQRRAVPITQIADIRYEQEDGIIWRRDRLPTITVRADVKGDAQGPMSPTGSTRGWTRSARRCRWATGSSWAARSRIRRAASDPSPPACRYLSRF